VSIVQNGCLVVKEELWLKTPYHVVQLPCCASAAQNAKKTFQPHLALLAWPTWSLMMHFGSTISQLQAARPILLEWKFEYSLQLCTKLFNWLTQVFNSSISFLFWYLMISWSALWLRQVDTGMWRHLRTGWVHGRGYLRTCSDATWKSLTGFIHSEAEFS